MPGEQREMEGAKAPQNVVRDFLQVPGLLFCREFLAPQEQVEILSEIDRRDWLVDLKRRVQHFGYKYDYRARRVDHSMFVGELPEFAVRLAKRLTDLCLMPALPDQLIINEYLPGQGISAHVDCEPCFEDSIATVSLGWEYEMDMISLESGDVVPVMLPVGSALVFAGESRYQWQHRIRSRKSDHGVPRQRRVSLTFRNVILTQEPRTGITEPGSISP